MDSIKTHSHNLVVNEDNGLILDESGRVLVSRIMDGSLEYINPDIISRVFGIAVEQPQPQESNCDAQTQPELWQNNENGSETNDSERNTWNRNNILKLIDSYKGHVHLFKSTSVRNEKVWNMISSKVGYTSEQCKNKFKYLKSKYIKKKDNMSEKATGAKNIHFEYFEEFEELFANDPNIYPKAIASSSRDMGNKENISKGTTSQDKENEEKQPKKQKVNVAGQLKTLTEEIRQKEESRERRHREIIEQRERALTDFKEYLHFLRDNEKKTKE